MDKSVATPLDPASNPPERLSGLADRRFHQLRILTEVSRALTSARSIDSVQRMAVTKAAEMMGTEKAILLLGDDDDTLFVRASEGIGEDVATRIRKPSLLGLDERLALAFGDRERAYFGIPLVVRDLVSGLLVVARSSEPRADGEGDEWLVSALGDQAAVALDNLKTATPRQNDALFKLLVDTIDEYAIVALDTDGRVETWSVAAEKITGFSVAEVVSQQMHPLYVRADSDPETLVASALKHGRDERELLLSRKDGSSFWAKLLFVPMRDSDGAVCGFAHIIRDITNRRASDERLREIRQANAARIEADRERDRADALNRMKDEFLATVSHELRTPLTAILGWASILQDAPVQTDRLAKGLEVIARNARSQVRLIEDILDVTRIITGKDEIQRCAVDIQPIIESAIEAVQITADRQGVSVFSEFVDGLGSVVGDAERLQQVVGNLLSNALKFTPPDGAVFVRAERCGAEVVISVRDTGRGISSRFLPFVFDRFRQDDALSARGHSGLGLGLALVRHFVELHGGYAHAESRGPGQGTTMTIRLPVVVAVTAERGRDLAGASERPCGSRNFADRKRALDGLHVIVVEDDADAREVLAAILEHAGARVSTTSSAREATALLDAEGTVDVLISDLRMPEVDGNAFIRSVRSSARSEVRRAIPALALSAHAGEDERRRALVAGFHSYAEKPVDTTHLVAEVARLAGRRRRDD